MLDKDGIWETVSESIDMCIIAGNEAARLDMVQSLINRSSRAGLRHLTRRVSFWRNWKQVFELILPSVTE